MTKKKIGGIVIAVVIAISGEMIGTSKNVGSIEQYTIDIDRMNTYNTWLKNMDVSSWDTQKVTGADSMFH